MSVARVNFLCPAISVPRSQVSERCSSFGKFKRRLHISEARNLSNFLSRSKYHYSLAKERLRDVDEHQKAAGCIFQPENLATLLQWGI